MRRSAIADCRAGWCGRKCCSRFVVKLHRERPGCARRFFGPTPGVETPTTWKRQKPNGNSLESTRSHQMPFQALMPHLAEMIEDPGIRPYLRLWLELAVLSAANDSYHLKPSSPRCCCGRSRGSWPLPCWWPPTAPTSRPEASGGAAGLTRRTATNTSSCQHLPR